MNLRYNDGYTMFLSTLKLTNYYVSNDMWLQNSFTYSNARCKEKALLHLWGYTLHLNLNLLPWGGGWQGVVHRLKTGLPAVEQWAYCNLPIANHLTTVPEYCTSISLINCPT